MATIASAGTTMPGCFASYAAQGRRFRKITIRDNGPSMKPLAVSSLILVLLLLSLSSYLRLDDSGIGCEPWPQCYGHIAAMPEQGVQQPIRDTYERLALEAQMPLSWATPWHRLVASVLGVLILAMTIVAFVKRRDRGISSTLLALTAFLAWLGIYSDGLQNPAIVMGNLAGGFLMLGLLGWVVVRKRRDPQAPTRGLSVLALIALGVQILLGGLTSANFAATACPDLPNCQGRVLPHRDVLDAFDLGGAHQVNEQGFVVIAASQRAGIHQLHRLNGVLTTVLIALTGLFAIRRVRRLALISAALIAVVLLEFGVGVAAVTTDLPISLAVAHNWLAAIVLLLLLNLFAAERAGTAPLR